MTGVLFARLPFFFLKYLCVCVWFLACSARLLCDLIGAKSNVFQLFWTSDDVFFFCRDRDMAADYLRFLIPLPGVQVQSRHRGQRQHCQLLVFLSQHHFFFSFFFKRVTSSSPISAFYFAHYKKWPFGNVMLVFRTKSVNNSVLIVLW